MKLEQSEAKDIINDLLRNIPRVDCRTCDCFLAFITRLEIDSQDDVKDITNPLKPSKTQIHSCLGCDPCPPADAYTRYIKQNLKSTTQNQPCGSGCCSQSKLS